MFSPLKMLKFLLLSAFLLFPGITWGFSSNQWQHTETEHFLISYNEKTRHLVSEVRIIAEQIATTFAEYFDENIVKTKIAIVLQDHHDYSQGESYRDLPLVIIDCRKTDSLWRGDAGWLKNVLAHELGHAYSLRIMQLPIIFSLGVDLDSDGNGQEGGFGIHYRHNRLPSWFTEGIAQMASNQMEADFFDLYREMLLRDAFFNRKLLTLEQMARFEGNSRENELVYNQGFHLMLYLKKSYPDKSIKTLCHYIRTMGFHGGFTEHYGKSLKTLYLDWMLDLGKKYSQKPENLLDSTLLFPEKQRQITTEIRSADEGRFVIANWRHDFNRFDLFEMTEDRKQIKQIIDDTGMILQQDKTTGNIWFNRSIYNHDTGVANFDIFMIDQNSQTHRITHGKRCMAFDVQNNTLVYAAYENGTTSLVLQPEKGASISLVTFPYDTAVYHISMMTPDILFLSLARGNKKTVAILKNGRLEPIWENVNADVTDCIAVNENRLLFVSTISGSPQLYWCDLAEDKYQWFQITRVPGGVRFPTIEFHNEQPSVFYSVFQNGHHRIVRLHDLFPKSLAIDLMTFLRFNDDSYPTHSVENQTDPPEKRFAFITATPSVSTFIGLEETESTIPLTTPTMSTGVSLLGRNAPGNFFIGVKGIANKTFAKTYNRIYPTGSIWIQLALWQIRLSQKLSYTRIIHEYEDSFSLQGDQYDEYNMTTILNYQISNYDYAWLTYRHRILKAESRYEYKYSVPDFFTHSDNWGTLHQGNILSMDWQHIEHVSSFSPGRLGQPLSSINAGLDCFINRYPDITFQNYEMYYADDNPVYKFRLGAHKRDIYWQGKISLGFGIDGFTYAGGTENNKVSLYMYDLIGNQNMFSGYPGDIKTRRLLRTYGELRINPFINVYDATDQLERMHLGLKLEAGAMEYFHYGIDSHIPVSLETAYRIFFYAWPDRQSHAYMKCAFPLTDINELGNFPSYRLYLGISI